MFFYTFKESHGGYSLVESSMPPPECVVNKKENGEFDITWPENFYPVTAEFAETFKAMPGKYKIEKDKLTEVFNEIFNPSLEQYTASKRYMVECGGCMYGNNIIQTDRDSQTKMIAEMVALGAGLRPEPSPWKFGNGFVSLNNAQMLEVIMTARLHIATSFAVEASVLEQVALGNITTKEQIDAAPWPANR